MAVAVISFALGVVLALVTLRDVFDTVVVPGASQGSLRVARRLVFLLLPVWKGIRGPGRGLSTGFAPFILVASFVIWMLLLALAFGLITYALGAYFQPRITSLPQAAYLAGSALVTIGLSEVNATGPGRWIVLLAGFSGLGVMTMAVTYLLEVQGSVGLRDAGVLKLSISGGHPPSGVQLLERYAALGCRQELPHALREGREWCAHVLQSHSAHPSLIYFRTAGTETGWPAALGALLDAALIVGALVEEPDAAGAADLLFEQGERMTDDLAALLKLDPKSMNTPLEDIQRLLDRLSAAGYTLRVDADLEQFGRLRSRHAGCIAALADHLGTAHAPLAPVRRRAEDSTGPDEDR